MEQFIKLHISQDLSHWAVILFACCLVCMASAFMDMWMGIDAARANREPISSHALRRTVSKIIDYLRVIFFAALIDALGLFFTWYALPYFVLLSTLGVLLIEGKSVIENLRRKKSHAADIADVVARIISAAKEEDAEEIIQYLKDKEGGKAK